MIKTVRATHPKADVRLIEHAYDVAAYWHTGQKRKSGDPYITHPLAVATILAELGMNHETLCAALLHDTVEDTAYALDQLRADFGDEIAALVDGVTKLDKVKYGESPRPRPCARWSSRCPATSGSWSSSSPTGCTTCARCATCRGRSRSASRARRWRSSRRWPTGSA